MQSDAATVMPDVRRNIKPPRTLSPSGASTFRQCARRWKLRYIDRLPDPPGASALRGTFVHHVLEELLAVPPAHRTLERARTICRDLWPTLADSADFAALGMSADDERGFRWSAWRDVEGFFALVDPAQIDVVDRERDLTATLEGVPFRGVVDLVDRVGDGLRITDYKTGRPPAPRYVDSRLTQVWLYAAAAEALGDVVSEVRLMYLGETASGSDRRKPTEIARPFDLEAARQAVDEHRTTWERIAEAVSTGQFKPTTGPLCSWCAYRDECPEGQLEHERRGGIAA